ncbi:hypothetical protein F5B20DRAFT_593640 [Whalleya microplaca]|nr:hypothetical protein F5B20DRAFT_593640 [Whalleya microplaca]
MSLDQLRNLSASQAELILNGPALEPPEGVTPNFEHPPNRNDLAHATNALCLILLVSFCLVRAYARLICVKKVRLEDFLALSGVGTYVGCIYCSYWIMGQTGLFVHQWDVQVKTLSKVAYILHIGTNLCAVTLMVVKAAILMEWNRLFVPCGTRNPFFWTCLIVLWTHTLFHGSWIIAENLSCIPHRKIWDMMQEGTCIDVKVLYVLAAVINLFTNIIILILPHKVIWSLQMSTKDKIGVSLIFAIGILACISSAVRLFETVKYTKSKDITYAMSGMYLWALAEMTCQFLVFCIPAVPRVFMGKRLPRGVTEILRARTGLFKMRPKGNRPFPVDDTDASHDTSIYPKIDENNISLAKMPITKVLTSNMPRQQQRKEDEDEEQEEDAGQVQPGILRTTQLTVEITPRNYYNGENVGNNRYTRYPWVA